MAHAAQIRIYSRTSNGERPIVKLIDSSYLPEGKALFTITVYGFSDA